MPTHRVQIERLGNVLSLSFNSIEDARGAESPLRHFFETALQHHREYSQVFEYFYEEVERLAWVHENEAPFYSRLKRERPSGVS